MNWFRSSILAAIVSLFVLTGYGYELIGGCEDSRSKDSTRHEATTAHSGDFCHCVCHMAKQVMPCVAVDGPMLSREMDRLMMEDAFPPAGLPQDIDYPPQLA